MHNHRTSFAMRFMIYVATAALLALSVGSVASRASDTEEAIWKLEHSYWKYVQENDLASYSRLWHKDFLGWPGINATPVHKDRITDWITSQTNKGLTFQFIEFKPAAIRVTGDIVVAYYWVTCKWVAADGTGDARTLRIAHTWVKTGQDWQILGGMSMPEDK